MREAPRRWRGTPAAGAGPGAQRPGAVGAGRTPGPVGFSFCRDDVVMSVRDLLVPTLTISDNATADALLERVGIECCNATAAELGMTQTVITSDVRGTVGGIVRAAGFTSLDAMTTWWSAPHPADQRAAAERRVRAAPELSAATGTRTSARDMCTLLRAIWTDRAAPPAACQHLRELMARQLTRDRLAAAFPPPVKASAKSGGLFGVYRHEAGVAEFPDGDWHAIAVLTRATNGTASRGRVHQAIGRAASLGVRLLRR